MNMLCAACTFAVKRANMVNIYMHAVLIVANADKPFDEALTSDVSSFVRTALTYKGVACIDLCILPDHLHMLLKVQPQTDLSKVLETLKYWLQDFTLRHSSQRPFEWDSRLWLVSKSPADIPFMQKYFRKQPAYHAVSNVEQEWADLMDLEEIAEEEVLQVS
jgi:REP element-mobilizing transposase RayT